MTEVTTALLRVIVMLLSIKGSCLIFSFPWQHFVFHFYSHDTLKHFQTLQSKQVKRKVQSTRPARESKDCMKTLSSLLCNLNIQCSWLQLKCQHDIYSGFTCSLWMLNTPPCKHLGLFLVCLSRMHWLKATVKTLLYLYQINYVLLNVLFICESRKAKCITAST